MRTALLAFLLLSAAAHAEDLGRLFFTPAERARLDAERRALAVAPAPLPASPLPSAREDTPGDLPSAPVEPITVNGLVWRAHGPSTAWINGIPGTRGDRLAREGQALRIGRDSVDIAEDAARARVKPGQTFEPADGRVVERGRRVSAVLPCCWSSCCS